MTDVWEFAWRASAFIILEHGEKQLYRHHREIGSTLTPFVYRKVKKEMEMPSCGDSTWMTMIRIVALWHPLLFGFIYLFHYSFSSTRSSFVFVLSFLSTWWRVPCASIVECSWRFPRWLSPTDSINRYRLSLSLSAARLNPSRHFVASTGFVSLSASDSAAAAHSGILRGNDNVITQHQRRIFFFLLYSPPYIFPVSSDHV